MMPSCAAAIAAAIVAGALVAHAEPSRGRLVAVDHTPLTEPPTRGPLDAPVTVEVFFSAGSELGNQAYRRAMALWRKHPSRVRLVFRPLLVSDASHDAAPIALAAHARGRFFHFMDELAAGSGPPPTEDATLEAAVRAGVDRHTAEAALHNLDVERVLRANDGHAERARIGRRTGDLIVNGRAMGPTPDPDSLDAAYRVALVQARLELAAGASPAALPALAARRLRCTEVRERFGRPARDDGEDPDDAAREARLTPVTGWHLSALLRDGTGCPPEPIPPGGTDSSGYGEVKPGPMLLRRTLPAGDLPSCGPAGAPVVIQVVCNLRSSLCSEQLERARRVAQDYAPSVRVVYRPWVDLERDDAELDLPLAHAAMCTHSHGAGWQFVSAFHGLDAGGVTLEDLATRARLEEGLLGRCGDAGAAAARAAIAEARAAGIAWSPTVVVGQRAYVGGFGDGRSIEDLIDAELAPGLLGAVSDAGAEPAPTTSAGTCAHDR